MLTNGFGRCVLGVLISVATAAALPQAQVTAPAERFEVASVKPYKGPLTFAAISDALPL